ncbi:DUF418 domain-containing protein [Prolixibacteraceae bacterium JC049]|nr:DUF418 domain-containing protein [Prolixibacteraceae bacterium JC049]
MEQIETKRISVLDAIRGFALIAIMILHNLEHFDMLHTPTDLPQWMLTLDQIIYKGIFFLFAGKAYSIFALMFGVTFYIQYQNQAKKGNDFRVRFAWRMILLLLFGIINSAIYQGDILTIYALLGFMLIPFARLNNRVILGFAVFLLLQPLEIYHLIEGLLHPQKELSNPVSWAYYAKMQEYIPHGSIIEVIKGNLTNGKKAVYLWSYGNGRFFSIVALFLLGYLLAKKQLFIWNDRVKAFWKKALKIAAIVFVPLWILEIYIPDIISSEAILRPLKVIESSWINLAFMFILLSGFMLLFHTTKAQSKLSVFSPVGRMSMSNYILQSFMGASIYYGFGLGLYDSTGATHCFLIGLALSMVLIGLSSWWTKHHKRGPLEQIWHNLTWIKKKS